MASRRSNTRLPPEVNNILFVKNLPYEISSEEMYGIFDRYGPVRQIRIGNTQDTRGTAYVVYDDIYDAKNALDHLKGFSVGNRYLIVLYHQQSKIIGKGDALKGEQKNRELRSKYNV